MNHLDNFSKSNWFFDNNCFAYKSNFDVDVADEIESFDTDGEIVESFEADTVSFVLEVVVLVLVVVVVVEEEEEEEELSLINGITVADHLFWEKVEFILCKVLLYNVSTFE